MEEKYRAYVEKIRTRSEAAARRGAALWRRLRAWPRPAICAALREILKEG